MQGGGKEQYRAEGEVEGLSRVNKAFTKPAGNSGATSAYQRALYQAEMTLRLWVTRQMQAVPGKVQPGGEVTLQLQKELTSGGSLLTEPLIACPSLRRD